MLAKTKWVERMRFTGSVGNHTVPLDAKGPVGEDSALTPKELVALGVSGCTAMDVVALMKKYKQPLESLEVVSDVTPTEGVQPAIFKNIVVTYDATGQVNREKLIEAVRLSQSKYCGVSAMISKAVPIQFVVKLNGEEIEKGEAHF